MWGRKPVLFRIKGSALYSIYHDMIIKKTNINYFKKLILGFFLYLPLLLTTVIPTFANNDLLNQAYDEAKRYDYVVNPGNDKNAVWAQVFNPTTNINLVWPNAWVNTSEPYLIRLTKLILRITIAISVSIIIFAGISYILAFGDAGKQKKAQNIIIYALGGIFIWLSSLAIVELTLSITKSSLKF